MDLHVSLHNDKREVPGSVVMVKPDKFRAINEPLHESWRNVLFDEPCNSETSR